MAEGGGEEDLDNPFSFKNYVKKKTQRQDEPSIDTDDIFSLPTAANRKKEKQSLVVEDDSGEGDNSPSTKKKASKGNPFSFKKFLDQKGTKNEGLPSQRNPAAQNLHRDGKATSVQVQGISAPVPGAPSRGPDLNSSVSAPPDFASDLPDFIQNHFSENKSRKENERHQLPDFTLESQPARNSSKVSIFSPRGRAEGDLRERPVGDLVLDSGGNSEGGQGDTTFSDDEDEAGQRSRHFDGLSLPDFLVDSAIPGAMAAQGGDSNKDSPVDSGPSGSADGRLPELPSLRDSGGARNRGAQDDATVLQLREENNRLRTLVAQMTQRAKEEDERVAGLEKELKRLQKKEAEETAVMERAVQQVEENLVATTTRAVQAETLVAKLKQDVKGLQAQVKALTAENEALNSGDKGLSDLRERTKYASEQLTSAAAVAENNLRELLGGVEKLKVLGHVLSSFEKVTDVDDSQKSSDTTV